MMATQASTSSGTGILDLPNELALEIGKYVATSSRDLASLLATCKPLNAVVGSHGSGVWSVLYQQYFDLPDGRTSAQVHDDRKELRDGPRRHQYFATARGTIERLEMPPDVLFRLLKDAFANVKQGQNSKNMVFLKKAMNRSMLLDNIFSRRLRATPDMQLLQLMFFHLAASPDRTPVMWQLQASQRIAYASPEKHPLSEGTRLENLNIEDVLHLANFFKYHMTDPNTELNNLVRQMAKMYHPRAPDRRLGEGVQKLGTKWFGVVPWVSNWKNLYKVRTQGESASDKLIEDLFVAGCAKDTDLFKMEMSFDEALQAKDVFPSEVTRVLDTYGTHRNQTKPGKKPALGVDYLPFVSALQDERPYLAAGTVSPLGPQLSTTGWQRFTMVRYPNPRRDKTNNHLLAAHQENMRAASGERFGRATLHQPNLTLGTHILQTIEGEYQRDDGRAREDISNFELDLFNEPNDFDAYDKMDNLRAHEGHVYRKKEILARKGMRVEALTRPYRQPVLTKDIGSRHGFPRDERDVWYYEGVVLPGRKMILGRWWYCDDIGEADMRAVKDKDVDSRDLEKRDCGPFLYWCYD